MSDRTKEGLTQMTCRELSAQQTNMSCDICLHSGLFVVSSELLMSDEVTGACTGRNVVVIVCGCVLLQN